MKNYLLLVLFAVSIMIGLHAQNVRIAYIDSNRIMVECNDTKEAQKLYQNARDNWDREIDELSEEIRRMEDEYERRKFTLPESGKKEYEDRIATKRQERAQQLEKIFGEEGLAAAKNTELLAPIMAKLRNIIDQIAVDENYSIVFDAATSGIIYAVERMDITQQVISEMNLSN